jgi:hypothetical protein
MPNLHDLATTIGNSSLLSFLSALAAGLAAIALMSGSSKVRSSSLPSQFPGDQEAQLDKYVVPFTQLDQVGKGSDVDVAEVAEQLKNQPAAYLGLTAFQKFSARKIAEGTTAVASPAKAAPKAAKKTSKPRPGSPAPHLSTPSAAASDGDDYQKTVDVSLPKPTNKKVK